VPIPPYTKPALDPTATCERCGAFGAYALDGATLCLACYTERGSCCAEREEGGTDSKRAVSRRSDIATPEDVRRLVDEFYGAIRRDELLNPIFTDVAQVDWEHHLPQMYAFWNSVLLGLPGYRGAPFLPHQKLPTTPEHFRRWVALFQATVDRLFAGARAQQAKDAASSMAHTFALRLGLIDPVAGRML
jgi:hemoglobin